MKIKGLKSLLLTGGTGSFGRQFCSTLYKNFPEIRRIVVFSRDELKQYEMQLNLKDDDRFRFFLGDIRDKDRLSFALKGVEGVVHAAALKQVPAAEYNPFEFIKTNVIGAQNLIECCLLSDVKKVVALSTDKAAAPINLYGATKLCSDKLFIAANNFIGDQKICFSVVRYGNVMGSRGSVVPLFIEQEKKGKFTITDERMTRFNITLSEGVNMVLDALNFLQGSEIFVPKLPSYNIIDLAKAVDPNIPREIVGIRTGEKLHEEMITTADAHLTLNFKKHFIILPNLEIFNKYQNSYLGKSHHMHENFSYNSKDNPNFLNIQSLTKLVNSYRNEIAK